MGRLALILVLASTLSSCAFKEKPVLMEMGPLPFAGNICRIAVLPFTNQTGHPGTIGTAYTRVFTSELIDYGNYIVSQEGDVRKILQQMKMIPGETLSSEQLRALADRLGVQIVITGAVLEMSERDKSGRNLDPALAVVVRVLEASSGRTLWITYDASEGNQYQIIMHFGLINSMNALAKRSALEILDLWKKKGFEKCSE